MMSRIHGVVGLKGGARSHLGLAPKEFHSFHSDKQGKWIFARSSKGGSLWDLSVVPPGSRQIELPAKPSDLWDAAFSADGRWLLTARYGGDSDQTEAATKVWDLGAKDLENSVKELSGHLEVNYSFPQKDLARRASADGRWLVTSSKGGDTWLNDLYANGRKFSLSGHDRFVNVVVFSPDGRRLLTSEGGSILVWDLTRDPPEPRFSVAQTLWDAVFAMKDETLITTGDTRVWNLKSNSPERSAIKLSNHVGRDETYALSRNERWFVSSGHNAILFYELHVDMLVEMARMTLGRNFTPQEWRVHFPREPYRKVFPDLPVPEQEYEQW